MITKEEYSVYDVFTPSMPAKEAFVDRVKVTNRLVDALRTPGKQIIIYGHSGSGKSTIIERKLYEVYENHVTTSCIKGMTFEAVLLDGFDQLDPFYRKAQSQEQMSEISAELLSKWANISSARSEAHKSEFERALPPQLTVQNFARFAGEMHACWVLEDFHKLEPSEKTKLAQAMKMFMDMAKIYRDIKSVAVGAVGSAREVVQYDDEMMNRVAEIEVKLMDDAELLEIIRIGSEKLGINFITEVRSSIVKFSNGLASICHQLCLNSCLAAGVEVTQSNVVNIGRDNLNSAIREYVETTSDSIRRRFDRAIRVLKKRKYENYSLILNALCSGDLDGLTVGEVVKKIQAVHNGYPANNISRYLNLLQMDSRGSIIRYDEDSGRYSFSDPFVRSYAQAYFQSKKGGGGGGDSGGVQFNDLLEMILAALKKS